MAPRRVQAGAPVPGLGEQPLWPRSVARRRTAALVHRRLSGQRSPFSFCECLDVLLGAELTTGARHSARTFVAGLGCGGVTASATIAELQTACTAAA